MNGIEAEQLQVEVLNTHKRVLGYEHPHTLTFMNNLASTDPDLGRYDEAELLEVAMTYSNLGQHNAAEKLHVVALNANKQAMGEEHPSTLLSMNNLAPTYSHLGRYNEAKELFCQATSIAERMLGDQHPSTKLYCSTFTYTQDKRQIDPISTTVCA